jgi:hypothetical protein
MRRRFRLPAGGTKLCGLCATLGDLCVECGRETGTNGGIERTVPQQCSGPAIRIQPVPNQADDLPRVIGVSVDIHAGETHRGSWRSRLQPLV